jgi:hypothetical protein
LFGKKTNLREEGRSAQRRDAGGEARSHEEPRHEARRGCGEVPAREWKEMQLRRLSPR